MNRISPVSPRLRAYLQLMRLPNVFTALADIFMGAWFVSASPLSGDIPPLRLEVLLPLLAASACLYLAGMVLNDVCDREQDEKERPERPIPSGRVPLKAAVTLGTELLLFGVAFAGLASYLTGSWYAVVVSVGLVVLILAYDAFLKKTWAGALAMGGCRTLNVLLGMTAATGVASLNAASGTVEPLVWQPVNYYIAGMMGAYVAGVTWFARKEAVAGGRPRLIFGTVVMLGALFALSIFPRFVRPPLATLLTIDDMMLWYLSWGSLAGLIGMLAVLACVRPEPKRMQTAVRISIWSLIPINAAICLMMQGPLPAIGVMILLIPTMHLGRWLYST